MGLMHGNEFQAMMDEAESAAQCAFKGVCSVLLKKQRHIYYDILVDELMKIYQYLGYNMLQTIFSEIHIFPFSRRRQELSAMNERGFIRIKREWRVRVGSKVNGAQSC